MIDLIYDEICMVKQGKHRARLRAGASHKPWLAPEEFKCVNCHTYVSCEPRLAGVSSRNHCPYCLWSRHLDLQKPGDRLAACREKMEPVGLTLKKSHRKYGEERGELMLIHVCRECGKVSINRIASDDIAGKLAELYERSLGMDGRLKGKLSACGVEPLGATERAVVVARLFGL